MTSDTLPAAPDSERYILGALVAFPECGPDVFARLSARDFFDRGHQKIFDALAKQHAAGGVDVKLLSAELKASREFADGSAAGYLLELGQNVATRAHVPAECAKIIDARRKRQLRELGEGIQRAAINGESASAILFAVKRVAADLERSVSGDTVRPQSLAALCDAHHTGGEKKDQRSVADKLVELALNRYRIGRTETDESFAVEINGPNVATMFRGSRDALRSALARAYRNEYGRTPNSAALADAMTSLQGEAYAAETEAVHLRVAEHAGKIVIDLGDTTGRAVVVGAGEWNVVDCSPVLFRRTAATGVLPTPERGGSLSELRELLNVTEETWPLVAGWLVAALVPNMPHPILLLGGQQGAGKTYGAKALVGVVDPSPADLRSQPRDPETWAISASASWVVGVDNVSHIQEWWSDSLCKAVSQALNIYFGQRERIAETVIESDGVALAIQSLVESVGQWEGTAAELCIKITPENPPKGWPRTPQALGGRLKRLTPALEQAGIAVAYPPRSGRRRVVTLAQEEAQKVVTNVTLSQTPENTGVPSDDAMTSGDERDNPADPLVTEETGIFTEKNGSCDNSDNDDKQLHPLSSGTQWWEL